MARCPFAIWDGPIPNETPNGMGAPVVGVVFHITGSNLAAARGWFHNPSAKASAHFIIAQDGTLYQEVDTADKAWHAVAANSHWIGVETEGVGGPLSEAGCQTFGRLYRWIHDTHGVPFQITDDPNNGAGFGWHGMGGAAWGGHDYCPGPERKAQRGYILQLAQGQEADLTDSEHQMLVNVQNAVAAMQTQVNAVFGVAARLEQGNEQFERDIAAIKAKLGA
jgi:predicted 3-demethylubiquinone-9 3-methyltransferase (glyoxalase superfamily)